MCAACVSRAAGSGLAKKTDATRMKRRYFTSLKTGALQRRSKELTAQKVTDALLRKKDMSTDISCVYVGCAKGDSQVLASPRPPCPLAQDASAEGRQQSPSAQRPALTF